MVEKPEILYLSYNGIMEPLVRSQVLNYLERLVEQEGYRFTLLTFERSPLPANTEAEIRETLQLRGIDWIWLPCHRRLGPLSTVLDIWSGTRKVSDLCRVKGIRLIHARSFVPAVIARLIKARRGIPFINDIRGFWVDEKVYKGSLAQDSTVYRVAKKLEAWVYDGSDAIVSLTDRGSEEIRKFSCFAERALPSMVTIPTCVDIGAFTWRAREFRPPFVFGYVGSLGPGYLPEMVFRYFALARQRFPGSRLHLITRTESERLWALADSHAVPQEEVRLIGVEPEQVNRELDCVDIGLSFIQPHFAKLASCPTKVGEYLAAGIPVISNAGIGDLDKLVGQGEVGYILPDFSENSMSLSLIALENLAADPELGHRCRWTAEKAFSLDDGVTHYGTLYRSLLCL